MYNFNRNQCQFRIDDVYSKTEVRGTLYLTFSFGILKIYVYFKYTYPLTIQRGVNYIFEILQESKIKFF